ncbi:MAG: integrase core domain-containing protein [Gemmatimonadales bacterium]
MIDLSLALDTKLWDGRCLNYVGREGYTAHQFLGELRWLGIRPTPSYVGEPECNGIMERWIRTLKEECLYLHDFTTLEEARQVIAEFIERYNREWLLERHGHRTPVEVRTSLTRQAA